MRIMGLDYGSRTVGVAVSDPLGITAQAVETICRKDENKLRKTCARIEELVAEYEVEKIVLVDANTQKFLEGKQPKKIIVVPNKIVNIVM